MYSKPSGIVLGFHGCDKTVRDSVVNGGNLFKSENSYDWLGSGIYFWENDPERAYEWAVQLSKRKNSSIKEPAVVGAVIDLGFCFNLTNRAYTDYLKVGYEMLKLSCEQKGIPLPENRNVDGNKDLLLRDLDCAVVNTLIKLSYRGKIVKPYDTVRGVFTEGIEIYPNAGFQEKTHVQISVINPNCIKGYFLPREVDNTYSIP